MTWEQEMREQVKERAEVLAQELAEEMAQERAEELVAQKDIETARKLLGMALALEQIAEATELPLAQVEQLRREASAVEA